MRFFLLPVCAGLLACTVQGLAAQNAPAQNTSSTPAACQTATTLDDLPKVLDAAIGGPANRDRTCLRQVMLPQARLSPMRKEDNGSFAPRLLSVDDWINAVAKRGNDAFYEVQVKVKTETYGHFAHLWSTYEIRPTPDGKPEMTGINSIQAVFDGTQWRVLSILWEPNSTAGPVPEKYLP
ncbi:MAG TPA: hypothetical protein VHZ28_17325 [Terracidiphilus sp.]|jgi:hypothetical protein|nr:hypothetical protein [Terracidiphilus sp.]